MSKFQVGDIVAFNQYQFTPTTRVKIVKHVHIDSDIIKVKQLYAMYVTFNHHSDQYALVRRCLTTALLVDT